MAKAKLKKTSFVTAVTDAFETQIKLQQMTCESRNDIPKSMIL
jgi:hypothetical protein